DRRAERTPPARPAPRRGRALRRGRADQPDAVHLPDDPDHGGDRGRQHRRRSGPGSSRWRGPSAAPARPRRRPHPDVRVGARALLRAAGADRRADRLALRHRLREPVGEARDRGAAPGLRTRAAGRDPHRCAAAARGLGERARRRRGARRPPPRRGLRGPVRAVRGGGGSVPAVSLLGATSGIVAAPCGAPAFAAVLTWVATTGSAVLGFIYLFAFSLGMTAILVVVGVSSGAVAALPRSGPWLGWIK